MDNIRNRYSVSITGMNDEDFVKTLVKPISYLFEPIQSTQWLGSLKWGKSRTICIHVVINPGFGTGGDTWLVLSLVQQVVASTPKRLVCISFIKFWIRLDLPILLFVTRSGVSFWGPCGALEATSVRFWWADGARNGGTQGAQRLETLDYASKHTDASVSITYAVIRHVNRECLNSPTASVNVTEGCNWEC